MEEWILDQFLALARRATASQRPWYWDTFLERARPLPPHGLRQRVHLSRVGLVRLRRARAPTSAPGCARSIRRRGTRSIRSGSRSPSAGAPPIRGNDFAVHGTAIVSFCDLCQLVLCGGTPAQNTAEVVERDGRKYIFCSAPCRWIFEREPERYAAHKDVVKRVLAGEAPANLIALLRRNFGLDHATWGKDAFQGDYPWLDRTSAAAARPRPGETANGHGNGDASRLAPPSAGRPPVMPVYGFAEGDTLGVVVLVRPDETARDLAQQLREAVAVRVAPRGEARIMLRGQLARSARHPARRRDRPTRPRRSGLARARTGPADVVEGGLARGGAMDWREVGPGDRRAKVAAGECRRRGPRLRGSLRAPVLAAQPGAAGRVGS